MADRAEETEGAETATRRALVSSLDAQREHVLGILDGLSPEQLRAPRLPSGWSCLGLVQHLALDVERYWFSCIMGGEALDALSEDDRDATGAWRVDADVPAASVLERYRSEIEASNAVISRIGLDAPPAQTDVWWGEWRVPDHRFVLLHVITETACHAGHLDAARELTDGRQWITLG